jgi:hypothetical protein
MCRKLDYVVSKGQPVTQFEFPWHYLGKYDPSDPPPLFMMTFSKEMTPFSLLRVAKHLRKHEKCNNVYLRESLTKEERVAKAL